MTGERYPIVYADCPWKHVQGGRGAARNHYRTMRPLDIAVTLDRFAADDALLLAWLVWPMEEECKRIISFAGFEEVTLAFLWVKTTLDGEGLFWGGGLACTRANTEPVFLFRRGKKYPRRRAANVHQVVFAPHTGEHSEKPEEVRRRIDLLYAPKHPRIELFSRTRAPGWAAWGDGVDEGLRVLPSLEVPHVG